MEMAYININIGALVYEAPNFQNIVYTGSKWIFDLDWTSQGSYYSTFDPTTKMILHLKLIDSVPGIVVFDQDIDINAPFDTNQYTINILDYYDTYSSNFDAIFTLTIVTATCQNSDDYMIPTDTYT